MRFPDSSEKAFEIAGDEIYIDARILKWKPFANVLALHTAYKLDRVEGRHHSIEQERTARRTVHSLAQDRSVDLSSAPYIPCDAARCGVRLGDILHG